MTESTASIIHVVAWGTRLSLNLYDFGVANLASTREANTLAKSVSLFALMLKQVGTSLKEDTTIPSGEAVETVQDIVLQAKDVFAAIQAALPDKSKSNGVRFENEHDGIKERGWSDVVHDRLRYMLPYVRSLNSTLAVMLQAFYTVRVIAWSRSRQDRLPPTATDAVANERAQLEVLIIEQQLLLLDVFDAFSTYQQTRGEEGVAHQQDTTPPPSNLSRYRDESIGDPQARRSLSQSSALVRRASANFSNEILARWTQLKALERRLSLTDSEEDRPTPDERRQSYQPTVESVASDSAPPTARNSPELLVKSPKPQRPLSARTTLPAPIPTSGIARSAGPFSSSTGAFSPSTGVFSPPTGPYSPSTGPFSPGPSYSISPASTTYFPGSPRRPAAATANLSAASLHSASFQGTFPPRALPAPDAAPTTANVDEETADGLDIPWRLWQQSNRWDFVDDKVVNTNAAVPPDQAFTDRGAWTEVMQKWVRREALEEARYSFNQVQKEVSEGGRTGFETCFCIGRPLTYSEIRRLVDRSIELYRASTTAATTNINTNTISATASSSSSSRRDRDRDRDRDYYPYHHQHHYRPQHQHRRRSSHNPSASDDETSDTDTDASDTSSSRRRVSKRKSGSGSGSGSGPGSGSGSGSGSGKGSGSGSSRRRKEYADAGSSTFGTLAKYGGIATLLEGLPEILGAW